jgi:hypothetical protein
MLKRTENYSNSHKDFPKSGEALGQTRASAAHNSEIVYESRYKRLCPVFATNLRANSTLWKSALNRPRVPAEF